MNEAERGLFRARLETGERMVVITQELFDSVVAEVEGERDRARALAAKLEEVVAMRTLIVKALAERDPDVRPDQMIALQAWARAQLSEIP